MSSDATASTVPSLTSQAHSASASAGAWSTREKEEETCGKYEQIYSMDSMCRYLDDGYTQKLQEMETVFGLG